VALDRKLSPHTPNGLAGGSLILQPTAERRRSGSHYTPRALTEPIVAEAFRPWLERFPHQPTAEQILALKVCDPAMGSGAFLVAVCRYLAGWLVQAWEREGYPEGFKAEWDKDNVARRLIAQRCLYGVDKNPFAVNLARLSLWLVTLSQELPFTFVDHALKCGDSLVGYSVREIQAAMSEVQLGFLNEQNQVFAQMGIARRESFGDDNLSDEGYDRKKILLQQQIKATDGLRQAGDLMVAAFFDAPKAKDRGDKQQVYLAMLSGAFNDEALEDSIQEIRARLAAGDKGITPFHWDLEFPEVFSDQREGFDAFVGNPPFAGKNTIAEGSPEGILDWFKQLHPESHGNADLVAHFFRRCFHLLRPGGSLGLIATNTIAQGDTRSTGLRWICLRGGSIYSANKRHKWPGVAAVTVSTVHIHKGKVLCSITLDRKRVNRINAFLLSQGPDSDPATLEQNRGRCFQGCVVVGKGFTFDNTPDADDTTPGTPSPTRIAEELLSTSKLYNEIIKPYMGGEELNKSPQVHPHRYVINLGELTEHEANEKYPLALEILRSKVKPDREAALKKSVSKDKIKRAEEWWRFARTAKDFFDALGDSQEYLAISQVSQYICFDYLSSDVIPSHRLYVIPSARKSLFGVLQSSVHDCWALFSGSSLEERFMYTATGCFETFCFPVFKQDSSAWDASHATSQLGIEVICGRYHQFRAELMVSNNEGLTSTYNRFHDPSETSPELHELRRLHGEMDQAVLAAYGWSDVPTACGFGLDYLDTEDDAQLPDELQERIDSGELFFWDANDALDFQGQLQAHGAITGRRKLPWRYRWPDSVRDDVLARLLALNAERYAEEVAMGLHSKGAKQAAKASGGGKRRGRPAKTIQGVETEGQQVEQIGLGL